MYSLQGSLINLIPSGFVLVRKVQYSLSFHSTCSSGADHLAKKHNQSRVEVRFDVQSITLRIIF